MAAGTALIPDRRVRHFWDPDLLAGKVFAPIVGSTGPAWDVWMLFDRGARWTAAGPPDPAWWEHQLSGLPASRYLKPSHFARKAAALEAGTSAEKGS